MRTIRLKISDLFEFEGERPSSSDVSTITPIVMNQFGFLPKPITVTTEGDEVVLQFATLTGYRKSLIHECVTSQRRITEADLAATKRTKAGPPNSHHI